MPSPGPASPAVTVQQLLQELPHLWRGREHGTLITVRSSFEELDRTLPGGGWPLGTLVELVPHCDGIGELSLALPALKTIIRAGRQIALVRPPYVPYAPAFRRADLPLGRLVWVAAANDHEGLWAAEQLLRGGAGAVLLWSTDADDRHLRRLQLAAESSQALAFIYRPLPSLRHASPAGLRMELEPRDGLLRLKVLKVRGGHPCELFLSLPPGGNRQ